MKTKFIDIFLTLLVAVLLFMNCSKEERKTIDAIHLVLEIVNPDQGNISRNLEVITDRLKETEMNYFGVYKLGQNRIIVQMPESTYTERIKELITIPGNFLLEEWTKKDIFRRFILKGSAVDHVEYACKNRKSQIKIYLRPELKRNWARTTGKFIGKKISVVLDDKEIDTFTIKRRDNSGSFTICDYLNEPQAKDLSIILNTGAFASPVAIVEESKILGLIGFKFRTGGHLAMITSKDSLSTSQLEKRLSSAGVKEPIIQKINERKNSFLIWFRYVKGEDINELPATIRSIKGISIDYMELVSPNFKER